MRIGPLVQKEIEYATVIQVRAEEVAEEEASNAMTTPCSPGEIEAITQDRCHCYSFVIMSNGAPEIMKVAPLYSASPSA